MDNILTRNYPEEEIFVIDPVFNDVAPEVTVSCLVPKGRDYTRRPVPYVTAENYVRILSQTSYLLAHHVLLHGLVSLDVNPGEFLQAMENYELYYRNLAMTFHRRVGRGEAFEMELVLKNWREIRRIKDFIIFTFSNKRTVISGEMSFVFVR